MNLETFDSGTQWTEETRARLASLKRAAAERQRRQPVAGLRGSVVRVECAKARFADRAEAARWCRQHDFRADRYAEHEAHFAFHQRDLLGRERTIELDYGVVAVVADGAQLTVRELLGKAEA